MILFTPLIQILMITRCQLLLMLMITLPRRWRHTPLILHMPLRYAIAMLPLPH